MTRRAVFHNDSGDTYDDGPNTLDLGGGGTVSYGTPAPTWSTVDGIGSSGKALQSDAEFALFLASNPATLAYSDSPSPGTAAFAARLDHHHGMPAAGTASAGTASVATDPIWDTKGDLAAATGADTAVKVAVGADYSSLMALSSATPGIAWVPGGSVLLYDYTVAGSDKANIDTGVDNPDAGVAGTSAFPALRTLEIWLIARVDDSSNAVNITLNNDTGAKYDRNGIVINNGGSTLFHSEGQTAWVMGVNGSGNTASYASMIRISIPGYAGTTFFKVGDATNVVPDSTASFEITGLRHIAFQSTAALTRFKIAAQGTAKLKVGSRVTIYAR